MAMKLCVNTCIMIGLFAWTQVGYSQAKLGKDIAPVKVAPKAKIQTVAYGEVFRHKLKDGGWGPHMVIV